MTSTIFVSSTFLDLQSHRRAIWEALQKFDVTVRGMEQFGARTETPLQTCIAEVDQSDIYIGIIAFRLGSIEPTSGKSYTQLEYERALNLSKEICIYLIDEQNARVLRRFIDAGETLEKLDSFKSILRERHTVDTFVDEADLVLKLERDLSRHVQTRTVPAVSENEDDLAIARLRQFAILPKAVSGSEVRVRLKLKGALYPVSKGVCSAFNLEFGATAGAHVELIAPTNPWILDPPDLLIPAKLLVDKLPLERGDTLDCYLKLHFSPSSVSEARARFRDRVEYPDSKIDVGSALTGLLGRPVVSQADSQLAFEASQIVEVTRVGSAA